MLKSFSQSMSEPEFVQNPYRFYEKVRSAGDLFLWTDRNQACAISHRAANAILRGRSWGREKPGGPQHASPRHLRPFMQLERHSMLELDPPEHTRLRALVNRAFTRRRVDSLEPAIRRIAENLAGGFPDRTIELRKEFAERLPVMVIAELLGVPQSMCSQMLHWSHEMVAMYQANRDQEKELKAANAAAEFAAFIREQIEFKRTAPADDLMSDLISAEDEGGKLTGDEMVSTCILLLNAGHEATANSIGNGVKAIIESERSGGELLAPVGRQAAIEEVLRFDPPLHIFERHSKEDQFLYGQPFRRGETVAVLLAAANRDPSVFAHPDEFIPERAELGHVSFGAGIHFCVGAPLAKLELAVGLAVLFETFPRLEFAAPPIYADRYHFRGLEELWLNPQP